MRVLMTTDSVGGVWTYALELAEALADRDVEVVLASMGAPLTADQRAELRAARLSAVYASGYALEWMQDPWGDVERAGEWLVGIADRERPDVVHLNGYVHGALPWPAPVVIVGHSDVLSWFEAVRGHGAPVEWDEYRRRAGTGIGSAELLVAPTAAMLDTLLRLYRPACEAVVVHNGRRARPGTSTKERLVVSAGRFWDEAKNLSALVRVAPDLPWPIALAGQSLDPGLAHAPQNMRLLGRLPRKQVDELLDRASIFALPARYEPFGLAALEAGLAGCALVLGDIESLREVWDDAALFVHPDDPDALSGAVRRLIEDPALLRRRCAAAAARASLYTTEGMVEGYLAAYARAGAPLQVAA